ncbi:MAG: hypothetical protein HRT45_14560 [Bdellovibrionales bacterium]|nr:hypothetical protein [Bdellovibrionales bacterium]
MKRSKLFLPLLSFGLIGITSRAEINQFNVSRKAAQGTYTLKQALHYFDQRESVLKKQFAPQYDPYLGNDSVPEECKLENLPKPINGKTADARFRVFSVYASKFKTIGDCSEPTQLLKVQYLVYYCFKSNQIFTTKIFTTDNKAWPSRVRADCSADARGSKTEGT